MCDQVPGELILCSLIDDPAAAQVLNQIAEREVGHVELVEGLDSRLTRLNLPKNSDLRFQFHLVRVPAGEEIFKINYIQYHYKIATMQTIALMSDRSDIWGNSSNNLQVVPNSYLYVSSGKSLSDFSLNQTHDAYKAKLGLDVATGTGAGVKIAVVDSGIGSGHSLTVGRQANLIDNTKTNDVSDELGHGSAMALTVFDCCPDAEFFLFKVVDSNGRASEWDTLAALAASSDADVINMSLSFGLKDQKCTVCGRESHSSRSAVFQNMVEQLSDAANPSVVVGAAGNGSLSELSFPARFGKLVAVCSTQSGDELSTFSNQSVSDENGDPHDNVFVAPGGEYQSGQQPTEFNCSDTVANKDYAGTSVSAVYATAAIASIWSETGNQNKTASQILSLMKTKADSSIPNSKQLGNGLIRV